MGLVYEMILGAWSGQPQWRRMVQQGLLLLILSLAWLLRISYLTRQSIWYDEGLSIYYARSSLVEMLHGVSQSDHPPLHPLLLHVWMRFCGDSEFAVRLLSVWWNVLGIALLFRLGRRLFDWRVGASSALLLALSPMAVWFSQETRGYTLALTLIIGAADAACSLFPRLPGLPGQADERGGGWAAWMYVGWAAAAMYAHFYSGFVLLGLNLAAGVWWLVWRGPRWRRQLIRWLAAQVGVLLLFGPWLPFVVTQLNHNATYWHGAVNWKEIVFQTLSAFSVGQALQGRWAWGATWSMTGLALLGLASLVWRPRDRLIAAFLGLWLTVPTAIMIGLGLFIAKFSPRYLLNVLPAFLLLALAGAGWLVRLIRRHASSWWGWGAWAMLLVAVALLAGATVRSLTNYYLDGQSFRPDMRSVVRYIEANAGDRDVVVLVGGYIYPAFTYYARRPLPVIPLPDALLPMTHQPVEPAMLGRLNQAIVGKERLWLVLWQPVVADPTGLVMDALEQTYHRLGVSETFHEMALLCFDVSSGVRLNESPRRPLLADFDDQIQLLGYDLPVSAARPGDTLYVYLYWQSLRPLRHDYKAFVQIIGADGQVVAQEDRIAGAAEYPTSHWAPGLMVRNRFLLTVQATARPGAYRLIAGFYRPGGEMPRLPVSGAGAMGDYVELSQVDIQIP